MRKAMESIQNTSKVFIILGLLILINILAAYYYYYIDITTDKRFLLTKESKSTIENLPNPVFVKILLAGDFPAGFKRLQQSTIDICNQFHNISSNFEFEIENPLSGSEAQNNEVKKELAKSGIVPVNLRIKGSNENKEQLIYPYAIINYGERKISVNLLENVYGANQETNLSSSISLLEYKIVNGVQKALTANKKNILITKGNGELEDEQIKSLESAIYPYYNFDRINLDSSKFLDNYVDALIVVRPTQKFSERNKFIIDQYIMNGGKVLWFVDGMRINLDSLNTKIEIMPEVNDVNLTDMLFKYGVRIEPNLVLDIECAKIPQVIGKQGGKPQIELFPWYYHPLIGPVSVHPIVRNIDRILSEFPSSIDTVKTKFNVVKTPLLLTSQYSRFQLYPMKVSFDILRYKPDIEKFNKPHLPIAYLLEGNFSSNYENRVEESMINGLKSMNIEYKTQSPDNKMIVVADGDILKNLYDKSTGKFAPMGYNKFEELPLNGNKEFILNALEYLTNDKNILSARSKELKQRLLNGPKVEQEKSFWQFLNVALPLILLALLGIGNFYYRKNKYIKLT